MSSVSTIQLVIQAQDDASRVLKKFSGDFSSISKRFSTESAIISKSFKYATLGVGALATGITALGISSIKSFGQAQKQMASFNATMAATKKGGEEVKKQLLAAAAAAVKLGFDDEDTAQSLARFYQRTNDVNRALKLNQVAMDLSRAKSLELEDASRMVSMVLSGNGKALKEYGIILKEGSDPLKALAELQKMVAGQSEAYSKTLSGQMETLGVVLGNLKETLGGALAEAFLPFTTWLKQVSESDTTKKWVEEFSNYIKDKLRVQVEVIVKRIKDWYAAMGGADGLKQKIIETKDKIVEIIDKIISFTSYIYQHRDSILKAIIAWEIFKISISIFSLISSLKTAFIGLYAIMGGVPVITLLVTAAAVAGVAAAVVQALKLKKAMDDVTAASKAARDSADKLIKKAQSLPKDDPARKKLLQTANTSLSSQAKIYGDLAESLTLSNLLFGRDAGGSVQSGMPYVVGEHRPEVFVPSQSGNIRQMNDTAKDVTVTFNNVNVRSEYDLERIVQAVKSTLSRDQKFSSFGIRTL